MDKTYSDLMDIVNRTKKFDSKPERRPVRRPEPEVVEEDFEPREYDLDEPKKRTKKASSVFGEDSAIGKAVSKTKATKKSSTKSTTTKKKTTAKKSPAKKKVEDDDKVEKKPAKVKAQPKPAPVYSNTDAKNEALYAALQNSLFKGGTDISEYMTEDDEKLLETQSTLKDLKAKKEAQKINAEITKEQQEYEQLFTGSLGSFYADEQTETEENEDNEQVDVAKKNIELSNELNKIKATLASKKSPTSAQSVARVEKNPHDATFELETGNKDLDKKIAEYYKRKQEKINQYKAQEENYENVEKKEDETSPVDYEAIFGGSMMSRDELLGIKPAETEKPVETIEQTTEEPLENEVEEIQTTQDTQETMEETPVEKEESTEPEKTEESKEEHLKSILSGLLFNKKKDKEETPAEEPTEKEENKDSDYASVWEQGLTEEGKEETQDEVKEDLSVEGTSEVEEKVTEGDNFVMQGKGLELDKEVTTTDVVEYEDRVPAVQEEVVAETTTEDISTQEIESTEESPIEDSEEEESTEVEEEAEDEEDDGERINLEFGDDDSEDCVIRFDGIAKDEGDDSLEIQEETNQDDPQELVEEQSTEAESIEEPVVEESINANETTEGSEPVEETAELEEESTEEQSEQESSEDALEEMLNNNNLEDIEGVVADPEHTIEEVEELEENTEQFEDKEELTMAEDQKEEQKEPEENVQDEPETTETDNVINTILVEEQPTEEDLIEETVEEISSINEPTEEVEEPTEDTEPAEETAEVESESQEQEELVVDELTSEDATNKVVDNEVVEDAPVEEMSNEVEVDTQELEVDTKEEETANTTEKTEENESEEPTGMIDTTEEVDNFDEIVRNERLYEASRASNNEMLADTNSEDNTYVMNVLPEDKLDLYGRPVEVEEEEEYSRREVVEEKDDKISKEEFYNEMARLQENLINELKGNKVEKSSFDFFAEKPEPVAMTEEEQLEKAENIVDKFVEEFADEIEEETKAEEETVMPKEETEEESQVGINAEPVDPADFDKYNLLNKDVALGEEDLVYSEESEEEKEPEKDSYFYLSPEHNAKETAIRDEYMDIFQDEPHRAKDVGDINFFKSIGNATPSSEILKQETSKQVNEEDVEAIYTLMGIQTKPTPKDEPDMKVLYVSSECQPFAASGGLADVTGSLPKAIAKQGGVDIRVIMPLYGNIKAEYRDQFEYLGNFTVHLSWRQEYCGLFRYFKDGVTYYFIDNERYFKRDNLYGYYDDGERFAYFCKAIVEGLPHLNFFPDIIHCCDWQSSLVSAYIKTENWNDFRYYKIKHIYTIHNVEYQGVFGMDNLKDLFGIDFRFKNDMEYNGDINLTKAAIQFSDKFSTVSHSYCDNLKQPYCSRGLHHIIIRNEYKLSGILNGIDYDFYNPATDRHIFKNYDYGCLEEKVLNKKLWQDEMGLPVDGDTPMISIVSRLANHKGMDLIMKVIENTLQQDIQLVVVGTGEEKYTSYFKMLENKYPTKVRAFVDKYSNELARKAYAASDIFLMPSKIEPCGLSQMIASRYGTVPIVREVGGLKDSIKDFGCEGGGNGYTFTNYNPNDLSYQLDRAIKDYSNKSEWKEKMKTCMSMDFTWDKPAKEYIDLYKSVMDN